MKSTFFILLLAFNLSDPVFSKTEERILSDEEVLEYIEKNRPLKSGVIHSDLKDRLGTTHVGGKYFLTKEPFLLEGARKIDQMGYGVAKFWFRKNSTRYYPFNSKWDLPEEITLKELAQHPYWKACFELPFSTFALSIGEPGVRSDRASILKEKEEIYELTKYLLEQYKDREVTFILHNWEGDWILRGGTGEDAMWSNYPGEHLYGDRYGVEVPDDALSRVNTMVLWFKSRQAGVSKARAEMKDRSKCKVFHAIEANKVLDSMYGIPGIANCVLPFVETDMVSWSSYDGLDESGIALYRGLKYLRRNMRSTEYMDGKKIVFIGEIGIPEQIHYELKTRDAFVERWDIYLGVCLALDVPYLIHWQLYCNEPKEQRLRHVMQPRKTEEMRGYWLIRPDGTKTYAGGYFEKLMEKAGRSD